MELNKTTYNYIAEDWLNDHRHDVWSVQSTEMFADFFRAGDSVLDVGCGPGIKVKVLFQRGLTVTGIDFSESMIAIAKREVPQGEFQVMDINDLSGLQREFDGIFAQAVLLHISRKDMLGVLQGLVKKLKPGGYFYCAVKEKRVGQPEEEIKWDNDCGYSYERFFSYFTLDEMLAYMRELDLTVVWKEITPSGRTRWIQVIARK